jgi:hypothetical protein
VFFFSDCLSTAPTAVGLLGRCHLVGRGRREETRQISVGYARHRFSVILTECREYTSAPNQSFSTRTKTHFSRPISGIFSFFLLSRHLFHLILLSLARVLDPQSRARPHRMGRRRSSPSCDCCAMPSPRASGVCATGGGRRWDASRVNSNSSHQGQNWIMKHFKSNGHFSPHVNSKQIRVDLQWFFIICVKDTVLNHPDFAHV